MTGAPHLPRSALLFARVLRGLGLSVAADDVTAFLQSMQAVGVRSRDDLRAAARSLFTTSVTQHERFDRAFDRFWSHRRLPNQDGLPPPQVELERTVIGEAATATDGTEESESSDRTLTWSATERLRRKDFGAMDDAELQVMYDLIDTIRVELPLRAARRTRPAHRGHLIDMRGSLRARPAFGRRAHPASLAPPQAPPAPPDPDLRHLRLHGALQRGAAGLRACRRPRP